MIAILQGTIGEKFDHSVIVMAGGVGYEVAVCDEDYGQLAVGSHETVYVYEQIGEKQHDLYGFTSRSAKQFFELLLGVNGVGPRMALALLNLGNTEVIQSNIASGNTPYLTGASGVGKRLAERIIVELKDKLSESVLIAQADMKNPQASEALEALIALGYGRAESTNALANIAAEDTASKIKQALKELSK